MPSGSARLAIRRRDVNVATKANNVIEPQRLEKAEKLRVAEAAIGVKPFGGGKAQGRARRFDESLAARERRGPQRRARSILK